MGKLNPIYIPQTQSEQTHGGSDSYRFWTQHWAVACGIWLPSDSQDQGNKTQRCEEINTLLGELWPGQNLLADQFLSLPWQFCFRLCFPMNPETNLPAVKSSQSSKEACFTGRWGKWGMVWLRRRGEATGTTSSLSGQTRQFWFWMFCMYIKEGLESYPPQ